MVYNKLSHDQWTHQESLDPEQGIGHNRDLYIIWNEKTNFLKTAADQNFFNSSYFLWLDIGAVRHEVAMDDLYNVKEILSISGLPIQKIG